MPRKRLQSLVTVAFVIALAAPEAAFGQTKLIGGVSGAGTDDCAVDAAMHATVVRTGIPWYQLQPTNAPIDYSYQDSVFNCYIQNGMQIYYTLAYAPDWAGGHGDCGGGDPQCNMPNPNAWYNFVSSVIGHYTQLGWAGNMVFGIWNEPEGRFLTGSACSDHIQCWGILWQFASNARDATNPSARLAGPEMGTTDSRLDEAMTYMNCCIKSQDVISTHWYPSSADGPIDVWVSTVRNKTGRRPWITESGVNDCNDASQAAAVSGIMQYFAAYSDLADAYIYYQVVNGAADSCFGVHNRRAFGVLQAWADFITPPGAPVTLAPGQGFYVGQSVTSPSGQYTLTMNPDGSLTLYNGGTAIWGAPGGSECAFQASMGFDGNFATYDCLGAVIWQTNTSGSNGGYLAVQDDGNICVYTSAGSGIWWRFAIA